LIRRNHDRRKKALAEPRTLHIDLRHKSLDEIVTVLNALIAARAVLQEQGKKMTIKKTAKCPAKTVSDN
jgi:hypothetical protein